MLYPNANAAERRAMTRAMQARKRRKRLENDSAKQAWLPQSLLSVSAFPEIGLYALACILQPHCRKSAVNANFPEKCLS